MLLSTDENESTAIEQSFTPNTPVASNTSALSPAARWISKAITFLPATAPTVGNTTWNLEKSEASCAAIASVVASKFSARLKRATRRPLKYAATPPAYFILIFRT